MIFVYSQPDRMKEPHKYKDDVAIVRARNKKEAVECFKEYYSDANEKNVYGVPMVMKKVHILTDY